MHIRNRRSPNPRRLRNAAGAAILAALAGLALAAPPLAGAASGQASRTVSVRCRGNGASCTAVIGIAGGASNRRVRISLSDTDLKLVSVVARPSSVRGAYLLSRRSYSLGGSLYTFTLNAVQSIPKGATLTFRFSASRG